MADGAGHALERLRSSDGDVWDDDAATALSDVPLHRVFVYGSLRSGLRNAHLMRESTRLGDATTRDDYALVAESQARRWPYALDPSDAPPRSALSRLVGELHLVSTRHLLDLDALEEHPRFYRRRPVALDDDDDDAWMYVLVDDVELKAVRDDAESHVDVTPPGDWAAFVAGPSMSSDA